MNKLILFFFFTQSFLTNAQSYNAPESVEFDIAHNRWLVANTQSHQVISRDSNGVLAVFASGLPSGPYGIEIVGDTLFCCCGSSIIGFSLTDSSEVYNQDIGATFLNGITHDNSGNLIATDYTAKTIYRVNIATNFDTIIASSLVQSPNGIIFDSFNNRCVFVNWGSNAPVKAIDMSTFAVSTIYTTVLTNCDGIARDGNGNYYISNWGSNSIVKYDSSFSFPPITVADSLSHPADIYYNVINDTLGIPNTSGNTVDFVGFGTTSIHETENSFEVNVFPNPFAEYLIINSDRTVSKVQLFDISGREYGIDVSKNDKNYKINLGLLGSGNYLLKIFSGNKILFREVIKQ